MGGIVRGARPCARTYPAPPEAQQVLSPAAPRPIGQLATVAALTADIPTFPFASKATAVIETGPFVAFVVSHCSVYGEVVTSPSNVVKFAKKRTLDTAMGSCTVAVKATVPVRLPVGTVNVTTGAAPSVGGEAPRSMRP